jgi:hypothetical protein
MKFGVKIDHNTYKLYRPMKCYLWINDVTNSDDAKF